MVMKAPTAAVLVESTGIPRSVLAQLISRVDEIIHNVAAINPVNVH